MCVYVAFHKSFPLLTGDPGYTPIHVGKALSKHDTRYIGDNTGNHISEKNPYFSELTGLYWIWKNTASEWVGLCHYRRYFFCKEPTLPMKIKKIFEFITGNNRYRSGSFYTSSIKSSGLILTSAEVDQILSEYDVIVPVPRKLKYPVWKQYERRHNISDMEKVKEIISSKFPAYITDFNNVMKKKAFFPFNMFVMKRPLFNQYMNWLFTVLFELERISDVSEYTDYQKRMYGFISERLFDVWLTHNNLNYKTLPVLYFKSIKVR